MAYFRVKKFNGMAPAVSARLLSNDYAQEAKDVDFLSGKLEPTLDDLTLGTSPTAAGTVGSLYEYEYEQASVASSNTDMVMVAYASNTPDSWFDIRGFRTGYGTLTFSGANDYDITGIYAAQFNGNDDSVANTYALYIITDTNPAPTASHFGTSTNLNFFTNDGYSSALTNGPSVTDIDSTMTYIPFGGLNLWFKSITEANYNSIVGGTTYYVRLAGAATTVNSSSANVTASANINKSFLYIPPPLADLQFPPARYVGTSYTGYEEFIPSEFIKAPGDVRDNLRVGGTLSGGTPTRTAEITFFDFDGTNTIIFFKRTHFIASGVHSGTHENATVLVSAATPAVADAADDSLIGYTLTNFGSPKRTEATTYLLPASSTGVITDNDESADSVTINDLHTYDLDTSGAAISNIINTFVNSTASGASAYRISVEPNVGLFSEDNTAGGAYYSTPGVEGVYGGFFNTYRLLSASSLAPQTSTAGQTRSRAYSKPGYGMDPYFADKDTIISRKMVRAAASNGNDGNDNDTHTAGSTIDFTYAMYAYRGSVTSIVTDHGGNVFTVEDTANDIGRNDAVNNFKFHNLTSGAVGDISDSYDVSNNARYKVGSLSGGSRATILVGDEYKVTKTANVYEYEWYTFHTDNPFAQLVGAPGNSGVIVCNADAIISDQVQTLADPTGTDNLSGDLTLEEGDCVQFQGWGVDPSLVLANATQQASNSFIDFSATSTSTTAIHMYQLPDANATKSSGGTTRPFFRRVDRNMNWFTNLENPPQVESHTDRVISEFDAANGGPYWLVIDKPVKVHLRNGIFTPIGSTKSVVTGYHTATGSGNGTVTDSLKNFPINDSNGTDFLIGKTLVNYTRGWKATIESNTASTITVDSATEEFFAIDDEINANNFNFQHIAADQTETVPSSTSSNSAKGDFFAGDYYYVEEPIPATTSLNGQVLTEENFTFRALSLVSIGNNRPLHNTFRPSFGVWWYASRFGGTQITTTAANESTVTSFLEFSDNKVKAVSSPVTSDRFNRFYWTSSDTYPQVAGGDIIPATKAGDTLVAEAQWNSNNESTKKGYRLGIPAPKAALIVQQVQGTASDLVDVSEVLQVSYVYTYVSVFGEEGPPSIPSTAVSFEFGQEVLLTGIGTESSDLADDTSYNFGAGALKRIYRSNTGSTDTLFQFVDEIPFKQTFYVDTKDPQYLGEVLPSSTWVHPPDDDKYLYPSGPMQGLVELANGVFAGFTGKRICFSEPFLPHAWPIEYRKTVEEDIVALGATSNGVFALTKHKPYFFSGSDPSAMTGSQIDFAQSCVNADSVVDMGDAIYYAGPDGLCAISTDRAEIITKSLISPKQWTDEFQATTYKASKHESKYVALFANASAGDTDGFIIDGSDPESALCLLNRGSTDAHALYNIDGTDTLVVLEGTNLKEFRGGTGTKTYTWKSKKFTGTAPVSMSWVYINADSYPGYTGDASALTGSVDAGLEITVIADGTTIFKAKLGKVGNEYIQETTTPGSIPDTKLYQPAMRLPNNHALEWEVEINGTSPVNEVALSQSTTELIEN